LLAAAGFDDVVDADVDAIALALVAFREAWRGLGRKPVEAGPFLAGCSSMSSSSGMILRFSDGTKPLASGDDWGLGRRDMGG
jgi:hypothetical protein